MPMNFRAKAGFRLLAAALLCGTATVHAAPVADKAKAEARTSAKGGAKPSKHAKAAKKPAKAAAKPGHVGEAVGFSQWRQVGAFIDDLVARHGFDRAALQATMDQTHFVETAVQLMKPFPPGKPKNWKAYSERFIEPIRINAGVAFWDTYAAQLAQAEDRWGVPAEIMVGILGVETIYGRNKGNFRVMDALTTLAFAYPETHNREARQIFFRNELEQVLLMSRDNNTDPFDLRGSYAGAIGLPQFMPSSIRQYAVDFDNDGKIDLRNSPIDAIGSIANFLVLHGWQRGRPVVFPAATQEVVNVAPPWSPLVGRGIQPDLTRATLARYGLAGSTDIPVDMPLGLVDLQNGYEPTEYWLGGVNFFAITKYNRSYFYAMSVVDLGNAVKRARLTRQTQNFTNSVPAKP